MAKQFDSNYNFLKVNAEGYNDPTMAKALAKMVWENDRKARKPKFRLAWRNPEDQAKRG